MKIGLHMIVKDEAETIGACLRSVLPHVDCAVILDTGSTDGTLERVMSVVSSAPDEGWIPPKVIAQSTEWAGGFGATRQQALDLLLSSGDVTHVFWMDGDDVLVGGENLREIAGLIDATPGCAGVLAHYDYSRDPAGNLGCSHYRERLLAVGAIDRWVGRVHEILNVKPGFALLPTAAPLTSRLAAVPTNTWPIGPGGIELIHNRPPTKDTAGRNRALLEADLLENAMDPRTLFYLSQEYAIQANTDGPEYLDKAIAALEMYDAVSQWDQERYQGRHRLADFLRQQGRNEEALEADRRATELLPDWPDAWHGMAEAYANLGNAGMSLAMSDIGLGKPYPQTMLITNPLDYSALPFVTRAKALDLLGRMEEALVSLRVATAAMPYDAALRRDEALLTERVNRSKIREAVLCLDEALARHDENIKAADLLNNCVPYFLLNDPEIAQRKARRNSGVRHVMPSLNGRGRYREYYGEDNEFIPITRALGTESVPEAISWLCDGRSEADAGLPRAHFLLEGLRRQATDSGRTLADLTLIDMGCNDGWLGWWLCSEHGLGKYIGYDLNPLAIEAARSYGEFYPEVADRVIFRSHDILDAIPEEAADAIACFEVIEHVPDPRDLIAGLLDIVGADGAVYLSTPDGAFERGNIAVWDDPKPRGHVRALRLHDLVSLAMDQGEIEGAMSTTDGLALVALKAKNVWATADLYLGPAAGPWSPLDILRKGLGGSETMAVRIATRLAKMGYRVRVYGHVETSCIQQVEYLPWYLFDPTEYRDILIGSRCPSLIETKPTADLRVLWLHDADYPDLKEWAPLWDRVVCVGSWQKDRLLPEATFAEVIRNGVDLSLYEEAGARPFRERRPAVIYSSSPDRGLDKLLELWPEIYAVCDDYGIEPELHICYGFSDLWMAFEKTNPEQKALRERIEEKLNMPGVIWHGAMGQEELAKLQTECRVWAYPTNFPEVSCITAMEAQAAGLAIVASDWAALPDTLGGSGVLMDRPELWDESGEAEDEFIRLVVRFLGEESAWKVLHENGRARLDELDIDWAAGVWHALFEREGAKV